VIAALLRALDFAAERHSAQRRKGPNGAPYVNHLIEVATLLANVGGVKDTEVLEAAVLHDVLEDTETTLEELSARFGERVSKLVASLTDDKSLSRAERKSLALERLLRAQPATKLVKLADLCSNVRAFPVDWSPERAREYLAWSARAAELCAGTNPALEELYRRRWQATHEALAAQGS